MRTSRQLALEALVLASLGALFVWRCQGPRPRLAALAADRAADGGPYTLRAEVENRGGAGQVEVVLRLRAADGGPSVEAPRQLDLDPGERTWLEQVLPAPPGDYRPEAEVHYQGR